MLLDGCFEGIGDAALLPPGVLVPLVETNSCSVLSNRRFRGLIDVSPSRNARGEAVLLVEAGFIVLRPSSALKM